MLIIYYNCVIYFSVVVFVIITILYRECVKNKNNLRILLYTSLSPSLPTLAVVVLPREYNHWMREREGQREREREIMCMCAYVPMCKRERESERKGEKSKWCWGGEPSLKNDRTDTADNHAVDIVADQSMSSETPEPSTLLGSKSVFAVRNSRL